MGNICMKSKSTMTQCISPDTMGQQSVIFPDLCLFSNQNSVLQVCDGRIILHPYDSIDYNENSAVGTVENGILMVTGGNQPFSSQVYLINLKENKILKFTNLPVQVKGGIFMSFEKSIYYGGGSQQQNNQQIAAPLYRFDETRAKWIDLEWELSIQSSSKSKSSVFGFGDIRKFGVCLYPQQQKIFLIGGERWSQRKNEYKSNTKILAYDIKNQTFIRTPFKCPFKLINPICVQGRSKYVFVTGGFKQKNPQEPNLNTCFINLRNGEFKYGIQLPFPITNYSPSLYTRRYVLVSSYPKMLLLLPKSKEWMTFSINLVKEQVKQEHRIYLTELGQQIDKIRCFQDSTSEQRHVPFDSEFTTKKPQKSTIQSKTNSDQATSSLLTSSQNSSQNKPPKKTSKEDSSSSDSQSQSSEDSESSDSKKPKTKQKGPPKINNQKTGESSSSSSSDHGKMRSVSGMLPLQKYRPVTNPGGIINNQVPSVIRESQQESSSSEDTRKPNKKPIGKPPIKPGTPLSSSGKNLQSGGFSLSKPSISGKIGGRPVQQGTKQESSFSSSSSDELPKSSGGFEFKKPSVSGKLGGKPTVSKQKLSESSSSSSNDQPSATFTVKKPSVSGKIGGKPSNPPQAKKKPAQRIMMAQSGIIGKPASPKRFLKRQSDSSSSKKSKPSQVQKGTGAKEEEPRKLSGKIGHTVHPVQKMLSSPINYRAIPIKAPVQDKKASSSSSEQPKRQFAPPKSISSTKLVPSKPIQVKQGEEEGKVSIPAWQQVSGGPVNQVNQMLPPRMSPKAVYLKPALPQIQGSSRQGSSSSDEKPITKIKPPQIPQKKSDKPTKKSLSKFSGSKSPKKVAKKSSSSSSSKTSRSSEYSSSSFNSKKQSSSSSSSNSQSSSEDSNSSTKILARREDDHQFILDRIRAQSFFQLVFKIFKIQNQDISRLFQKIQMENKEKVSIEQIHTMLGFILNDEQYKVLDVIKVIQNTHQVVGKSKLDRGKIWKPFIGIGIDPQVKTVTKANAVLGLSRGLKLMIS